MNTKDKMFLENIPEPIKAHIEHLERVRRDFIANVSHELRTPLTVIRGYLESLLHQDHDGTTQWKKIFLQMYQHCARMENLIDDLLLLSHLETDELESEIQKKIDVPRLLKSLCFDAKNISADKNHIIQLNSDPKLYLDGVEEELKSLFSNIIINAVKYTKPGGRIDIRWYRDEEGHPIFSVQDTGIGIAEEHIPRITERFYRVDKARSRESGGTGLGLAIAKHVLIRHKAQLKIESELNVGSTFTCVFPIQK